MTMKTRTTLLTIAASLLLPTGIFAQDYCIPPGFKSMGGQGEPFTYITKVKLEGLNHTSGMPTGIGDDDGYQYMSNEVTPSLQPGSTYSLRVSSADDLGMGMLVTVWIDWNGDKSFGKHGIEKVAFWAGAGDHGMDITVPSDAALGETRMRVHCDMPPDMGHIPSDPCGYLNEPNHPIGIHGEILDYNVWIGANPTGISEYENDVTLKLYPNPASSILNIENNIKEPTNFFIVDVYGRQLMQGKISREQHTIDVSALQAGQYILMIEGASALHKPFQILR